MANKTTIEIDANARPAVREFGAVTRAIHDTATAAGRAAQAFDRMATSAQRAAAAARQAAHQQGAGAQFIGGGIGTVGTSAIGLGLAAAGLAAREGVTEVLAMSRANVALAASAKLAGTSFYAQKEQAKALARELVITESAAAGLQAQSTRIAEAAGLGGQGGAIARALANALAGQGRSSDEIPDMIRQLATGQDELFDKIGGATIGGQYAASPEAIYKATKAQLGLNRELTDTEKLQARVNAVLLIGAANAGAQAEKVGTLAGQWDFFLTDVKKSLGEATSQYLGFLGLGDVNNANGQGPRLAAAQFEDKLNAELARSRGFSAGVGTAAFRGVGVAGGLTAEQRERFGEQGRNLARIRDEAALDAVRFQDEQRRALPFERDRLRASYVTGAAGLAALQTAQNEFEGDNTAEARRAQRRATVARLRGIPGGTFGEQAAASYLIESLGGFKAKSLSYESAELLKGAYKTAIEGRVKQLTEDAAKLANIDKNVDKLANPKDPEADKMTQVIIENKSRQDARVFEVTADGEFYTL